MRLTRIIRDQLTQGLTVEGGAKAVAVGSTLGVFPILGFTTPLLALTNHFCRLNQPIGHAAAWLVNVPKLLLIIPFIRVGEFLFGAEAFSLSIAEFSSRWMADAAGTTQSFGITFVHAIVGYLVVAPLIGCLVYRVARPIVRGMSTQAGKVAVGQKLRAWAGGARTQEIPSPAKG